MKKVLLLVVLVCLVGCRDLNEKTTVNYRVIIAKDKNKYNGDVLTPGKVKYKLAFEDGHTEIVNFGVYSCLKIGDSVKFVNKKDQYSETMHPECK